MNHFVIFCLERSGSTLLSRLIAREPRIYCDGEIFHPRGLHKRPPLRQLVCHWPEFFIWYRYRKWQRRQKPSISHASFYGFKLLDSHVARPAQLIRALHAKGWHILYLERRSLFDQTISNAVAHHTRRFHRHGEDDPAIGALYFEPAEVMAEYALRRKQILRCREIVATVPHLPLVYETDLRDSAQWQPTLERVYDFFELESPAVSTNIGLKKTWQRPYSEIVTNYHELREMCLAQAPDEV
jgi:LPS sulfotransferase NodH